MSSKRSATQLPPSYDHSKRGVGTDAGSAAALRASRRCRAGESGFGWIPMAFRNPRLPSASRSRAATPGENPPGWVTDSVTVEPSRASRACRKLLGSCSQWRRTPVAGVDARSSGCFEMRNKIRPMRLANVSAGAAARVRLALLLAAILLVVEVVRGLCAHSLALLSDAGHVVTDLVVLGLSTFALAPLQRPAKWRRTFGYQPVRIH